MNSVSLVTIGAGTFEMTNWPQIVFAIFGFWKFCCGERGEWLVEPTLICFPQRGSPMPALQQPPPFSKEPKYEPPSPSSWRRSSDVMRIACWNWFFDSRHAV